MSKLSGFARLGFIGPALEEKVLIILLTWRLVVPTLLVLLLVLLPVQWFSPVDSLTWGCALVQADAP